MKWKKIPLQIDENKLGRHDAWSNAWKHCHNNEISPVHLKTEAVLIKLHYTYKDILSYFLIIVIMIITQKKSHIVKYWNIT